MRDPLSKAIAKHLAESNVGLFRKQLFEKLPTDTTGGNIEKVSQALNSMLTEGHVQKSVRQGIDGSRWSLTARGRSAYSILNDADETQSAPAEPIRTDYPNVPEHMQTRDTADNNPSSADETRNTSAHLFFDTRQTLDRALYGLVKLIKDEANQRITISSKAKKLALLESLENNELLNNITRFELGLIRQDLDQLEEQ